MCHYNNCIQATVTWQQLLPRQPGRNHNIVDQAVRFTVSQHSNLGDRHCRQNTVFIRVTCRSSVLLILAIKFHLIEMIVHRKMILCYCLKIFSIHMCHLFETLSYSYTLSQKMNIKWFIVTVWKYSVFIRVYLIKLCLTHIHYQIPQRWNNSSQKSDYQVMWYENTQYSYVSLVGTHSYTLSNSSLLKS